MDILQNYKPAAGLPKRLSIDYCCNVLLLIYIFTMPFVSAFSFTGTISLPLVCAAFLFILMIVKMLQTGKLPRDFLGADILVILFFLFFDVLSFTINGWGNSTSFNHTVAYISTFLLFYIAIKFTLFSIPDKELLFRRTLQFITYTTLLSAVYGNVEFISNNAFGFNLNDYIPRPGLDAEHYSPIVLSLFYRVRGFAYESGVYTQMLELLAPLTIYYLYFSGYCKWIKGLKIFFTIAIVLSIIFAASSATFVEVPIAIVFSFLLFIKKIFRFFTHKSIFYYVKIFMVIIVLFIVNNYLSLYTSVLLSITEKLDSYSMEDRQSRVNFFYSEFSRFSLLKKTIGAGPAATDLLGVDGGHVVVSLFYNVTFELGFIGLFLLISLISYIFLNTISIKTKIGFFLTISIVSGIIHYYVIHDFWVPWFWFVGAFSIFYIKRIERKPS
jgi:hypothetical protein